jgi:hypothetical protein
MNPLVRIAVCTVRSTIVLTLAAVLVAAAPALGGDAKKVEMLLLRAETEVNASRFEDAAARLAEAEKELDGIAPDAAASLKQKIAAVREKAKAEELRFHVEPLTKALQRQLDSATRELEEGSRGDGSAEVASAMERPLANAEEQLEREDAKKWLSDEVRADFKRRIAELRTRGEQAGFDVRARRAEKWIVKIEAVNAGTSTEQVYRDNVTRWMEDAAEELAQLPSADARKQQLSTRLDTARRGFDSLTANDDRDAAVDLVLARWKAIAGDAAASEEYRSESAPAYERWLVQASLEMPKTIERCGRVRQMLEDDEFTRAKQQYGSDARIVALSAELDSALDTATAKICAAANALLDRAESDSEANRKDLALALDRLRNAVEQGARGGKDFDATRIRADRAVESLAAAEAGKAAALAETEKKCRVAVDANWPTIVASCGEVAAIDPVACVEDVDAWKGRMIRVQGARNRARWDFQAGDYDFIVSVNGVPVAGQFAPELRAAIARAEAATGLRFDSSDIDDVVGEVSGACRVQGIEYSQLLKEHIPTINYKAPLLRIIAVKAGPFALSLERSASEGVAGLPAVSNASESGSSWLRWLILLALAGGYIHRRHAVNAWLRPRLSALLNLATRRLARAAGR